MKTKEELESKLFDDLSKIIHFRDKEFDDIREIAHQYAKDICELQKQECAKSAFTEDTCTNWNCMGDRVDKDSILNCKNVADEE